MSYPERDDYARVFVFIYVYICVCIFYDFILLTNIRISQFETPIDNGM